MAMEWKVAFPLHPEYRTLPMVWYVPPLSPINSRANAGQLGLVDGLPDVRSLRIPVRYLANLLTAGKEAPIVTALERLLAMRAFHRERQLEGRDNVELLARVGLTQDQVREMHRYLAIANYEDRFVIPTTHREYAENTYDLRSECGFSFGDGCSGEEKPSLFGGRMGGKRMFPIKVRGEERREKAGTR
jgi:nitrate reductase beta subunit